MIKSSLESLLKKLKSNKRNFFLLLDLLIIVLIFVLPYYIFEGKLFIGGDETRLQYIYPVEWIKNVYFYSWYSYSPVGMYNPMQHAIPFLSIFSVLNYLIPSKAVIDYLAFSLPLVLGYIFFKKALNELDFVKNGSVLTIGGLFYIFSPILIYKIVNPFLIAAWLIAYIPIISFLLLRYLKTKHPRYLLIAILTTTILATVLVAIPWILAMFLPAIIIFPFAFLLFPFKVIIKKLKYFFIFLLTLLASQAFWEIPYIYSFINISSSFAGSVLTEEVRSSFTGTVIATSSDLNIIYPLLNLFHRTLAFNSEWPLMNLYLSYFDFTKFLNTIFIFIIFIALVNIKSSLNKYKLRVYMLILLIFLLTLYFFTVNIGPLKDLFLWLGNIPGFVMFRNFYGKFSFAYVLYFSILFTFSLDIVINRFNRKRKLILITVVAVILVNMVPIKQLINAPLWKTENIYTVIDLPNEYINFLNKVKQEIPQKTSLLNFPFNIASYSIIKDEKSKNVYAGSSPTIIFAGLSSFSGDLSFNNIFGKTKNADIISGWIEKHNYEEFNDYLKKYNISYVLYTRNIPEEVKSSYLFRSNTIKSQDEEFLAAITDKKIIESSKGNYVLYTSKNTNTILESPNLTYESINPVKYKLYIKNISESQKLKFLSSFNRGWKLFLVKNSNKKWCNIGINFTNDRVVECKPEKELFNKEDLNFSFSRPVFDRSYSVYNDYAGKWVINPEEVKENYAPEYYKLNDDGSINIELVLYFVPQNYFYFGAIISFIIIIVFSTFVILRMKDEKIKK